MNLREKLYQMFILGTDGGNLEKLLAQGLGGVIFFSKDIESQKQFINLINHLKSKSLISPFLSIDQEGGRVERTENIHHGKKYLSAKYAFEKRILKEQTEQIAQELCKYGINLNFAPCVDVNTNPDNPIIGERAFSDNADDVIKAANIVIEIYEKNGIIPCIKHYPGHGDANIDSHIGLPEIDITMEEMKNTHIKPFEVLINSPVIMAAHLHCTCFDRDVIPASMSKNALSYLRNNLNYNGVIISDDMIMKGVSGFAPETATHAGLDMFIYRNSNDETVEIIENTLKSAEKDNELREKIDKSFSRIQALKRSFKLL